MNYCMHSKLLEDEANKLQSVHSLITGAVSDGGRLDSIPFDLRDILATFHRVTASQQNAELSVAATFSFCRGYPDSLSSG